MLGQRGQPSHCARSGVNPLSQNGTQYHVDYDIVKNMSVLHSEVINYTVPAFLLHLDVTCIIVPSCNNRLLLCHWQSKIVSGVLEKNDIPGAFTGLVMDGKDVDFFFLSLFP
jgi:hypothetical protein